jgi:hypothetical protein
MAVPPITQTFDPNIGEYGQDYALPVGSPIYSPIAGTVSTQDLGKVAWGKRVIVFASDAATRAAGIGAFAVGHLTSFVVTAGQKISAGQLLGYSGGATSDPSSGDSTGPHVEPQFFGLAGTLQDAINPVSIFKKFASWEQAIFSGGGGGGSAISPTSSSSDPLASIFGAPSNNATDISFPGGSIHIPNPFSGLQQIAVRIFWFGLGFALFVVGVFLIFAGDLEKGAQRAADLVEHIAPEAAAAA